MRRMSVWGGPVRAMAIAGTVSVALAGCSSSPGQSADPGDTLGNLFAFNSTKAPPVAETQQATSNVICPVVDVRDGGAAHRVYNGSGRSNSDVRYQFSIGETARECTVQGNQILIRVGVEGKVLLGPAGSAGSFTVPVFIGVQRDEGLQMLTSKVYTVSASIASGTTQTTFSVVSEPLVVPFTRENAAGDYTIYVGFEGQRETRPREARRRAR
jgi:hypothetical protein